MISYLFPGQGSQTLGMGATLFEQYPAMTEKADKVLGYSIKSLCLNDEKRQLNQTQYTQPAIYVVNALSYMQKIKQSGGKPDFVAGHSLGEYNALQAAGAISFEDGLRLVKKRGELMAQAAKGAMAAILKLTEVQIKQCLESNDLMGIDIANYNSKTQIVVSGLQEDIDQAQSCIEKMGGDFIPLNTSGAFHSRYLGPAKAEYENYLTQFKFEKLQIPVISNTQAKPYQQDQIAQNLANQITHSVKWLQSMCYLMDQGVFDFEEVGSGEVLTKLMTWIQADFKANANLSDQYQDEYNDLQNRIDNWNKLNPVGTKVNVAGFEDILQTRTKAMILLGHRMAIYIQGYKGYFALDRVTVV